MKNTFKKLGIALMAMALLWSCGKDDGPTPPSDKNTAPVIAAQEFTVMEDITPADAIGTVVASDADKDALTFSIKTNDNDLFAITAAGALTLAQGKSLDFATKAQHAITVEVSDGEDTASATITIKVTEVVPQNTAPEIADQEFTVAEDIADTEVIGTMEATDVDGDELTYSIVANDKYLFEIDPATGELSLAAGKNLDFETDTEHSITVEVSDGTATAQATVTIKVTDVDELAGNPNAFVTTWRTTAANEQIVIGTDDDDFLNYVYDYTIDWGDGTVEEINTSAPPSHAYATAGDHTVAILGQFPHIYMDNGDATKLLSIDQWGNIQWEDMSFAFRGCTQMTYKATDVPDLSQVTDMRSMFENATAFNGDIGDWDTSNVTRMGSMFKNATAFNQDIGGWDTSNVTELGMESMFENATAFNQDISGWDTSGITSFSSMFKGATTFDQPIGGWETSNVINMFGMFSGATSFNQNINTWDTSNVLTMGSMFRDATAFNGDVTGWDTSKVNNMSNMFNGASSFNRNVTGWDTSNVTNMAYMFNGATTFNVTLGAWDISSVTNMTGMLDNCGMSTLNYSFTLNGWNNQPNTPDNIVLGAAGLSVCGSNTGANAYTGLALGRGWTINDESGQCF
ncbi:MULTISPECIES: BspA family leucine-rich repeat surface protein [Flagellimonas]|uniref:BspA family leucine-rich repeat surface protein n=1 Tax=Flagellimonas hadalis TaxID=2597517 RepID=A0A5N5IYV5_9FLAO|nr:BspA family leucine-rich repeat surface protein [Allomuricauda hadalis]KAB5491848.1 BspA family leucine-rich repeat surface protein [Allomuricauda hadalis]